MTRILLLSVVAVGSALGVVYAKHRTRVLFAEVQRLELALNQYDVELGQLQLEQNTWAEHGRIERLARGRLGMTVPARESIIYIKP